MWLTCTCRVACLKTKIKIVNRTKVVWIFKGPKKDKVLWDLRKDSPGAFQNLKLRRSCSSNLSTGKFYNFLLKMEFGFTRRTPPSPSPLAAPQCLVQEQKLLTRPSSVLLFFGCSCRSHQFRFLTRVSAF